MLYDLCSIYAISLLNHMLCLYAMPYTHALTEALRAIESPLNVAGCRE